MDTKGSKRGGSTTSSKTLKHYSKATVTRDTSQASPYTKTPGYWQGPTVKRFGWRKKTRTSP